MIFLVGKGLLIFIRAISPFISLKIKLIIVLIQHEIAPLVSVRHRIFKRGFLLLLIYFEGVVFFSSPFTASFICKHRFEGTGL